MSRELPLIISEDAEWDKVTDLPARATDSCPFWLVLCNPSDGNTVFIDKPCGSWLHRDCPEPDRMLGRMAQLLTPLATVHMALEDYDTRLLARVRDRRRRFGGEGVSIRRNDRVHLYSTQPLPGREPPTLWIESNIESALYLLAYQSLRLPGLDGGGRGPFGWSGGWKLRRPKENEGEDWRGSSTGSDTVPRGCQWGVQEGGPQGTDPVRGKGRPRGSSPLGLAAAARRASRLVVPDPPPGTRSLTVLR